MECVRCEDALTVDHPVTVELLQSGQVVEAVRVSNADCYSRMLDSFTAAIEGHGQYLATLEDGLHNQHILDAAYRSWRTGTRQLIPPARSRG